MNWIPAALDQVPRATGTSALARGEQTRRVMAPKSGW
jgi:hypothetical protein